MEEIPGLKRTSFASLRGVRDLIVAVMLAVVIAVRILGIENFPLCAEQGSKISTNEDSLVSAAAVSTIDKIFQVNYQEGMGYIPQIIEQLMNVAMKAKREQYLKAGSYDRNKEREGYANGYKPKTLQTRMRKLNLAIPQVREGGFYPEALEKGLRSERAFLAICAEMYVNGVSTRKVSRIVEKTFGCEISASQVSRATAELDEKLQEWRNSALSEVIYLYLDARYEKIRENGGIREAAVLIATGVLANGKRKVLGVSVSLSEQSQHWREFLESLVTRGMRGVQLIISDDHSGLKAARQVVMGGIPWQRCQFHLQQNA